MSEEQEFHGDYPDKSRFDTMRWNSLTDTDQRPDPQLRDQEQAYQEEAQEEQEEREADFYDDDN